MRGLLGPAKNAGFFSACTCAVQYCTEYRMTNYNLEKFLNIPKVYYSVMTGCEYVRVF